MSCLLVVLAACHLIVARPLTLHQRRSRVRFIRPTDPWRPALLSGQGSSLIALSCAVKAWPTSMEGTPSILTPATGTSGRAAELKVAKGQQDTKRLRSRLVEHRIQSKSALKREVLF